MRRWSIAAAAAGLLAVCVAVPAQGAEWCMRDPAVSIQTSPGNSITVYVTEGAMGSNHQAALTSATTTYATYAARKANVLVVVYDYIPTDSYGKFATMMTVSSKPFGSGVVYGSSYGTSGSTMSVWFLISPEKD
jgi:hypothetical protein